MAQQKLAHTLRHFIDLVLVLTHKDLKVRYKSSVLGYLWSVAHPLALALVFVLAFKVIMRVQMENYALFLIVGLFPWQWFSNSAIIPTTAFLSNASIIKKVNFPRNIIPLSLVLNDMIHFLLSIPVIMFFMFVYHQKPGWIWLWGIPLLLIIQFCMAYGVALAGATINLFFRDLERLMGIIFMLLFYFTPVLYSENMIPDQYRQLILLNPLSHLMISWRNLFLHNQLDAGALIISALYGIVSLLVGSLIYRRLSWKFAEVL